MIDIHTHILPGIDDGSDSFGNSLYQISLMAESGVTDIVFTPHYIRNHYDNTAEIIREPLLILQDQLSNEETKIKLHQGAEIYLDENILADIETHNLSMAGTKYLLVETSLSGFPPNLLEILYEIVKSGYKPILAHPERYFDINRNPESAEDFMHRDVYLQINAGSLLGIYGKTIQKTAWYLVESGYAHFLASDNHCKTDEYILPAAVSRLVEHIDPYTAELLTSINPRKMLQNKDIDYFYLKDNKDGKKGFFKSIFH